jgi:hypothetical protein
LKTVIPLSWPDARKPLPPETVSKEIRKKRPLFITTASKKFATAYFLRRRTLRTAISPPRPSSADRVGSGTVTV